MWIVSRVRKVEISHFRSIETLNWEPYAGINCIVGPGDSGKSTLLDAIDLCLGARRNIQINDGDFYRLNTEVPIRIAVTLGDLKDGFKQLDGYGLYLRGFTRTGEVLSEPRADAEMVLTIQLEVKSDLDPVWSLYSERAAAQQQARLLTWADRLRLSCARLGSFGDYNFSWRKGSVLNRLSEERPDVSADLATAARAARSSFGDRADSQLAETLGIVRGAASNLGVSVGKVTARLDAQSMSLSGGAVCLHGEDGVPLRNLGLGSTRLLTTGLQRMAASGSSIVLVDELEYGLEPHRIIRLISSLGAKDIPPPLQAFVTTHSPITVREIPAEQILVLRRKGTAHDLRRIGSDMQGTVRACPEALLASSVIICEGASEIGLIRGLDIYRSSSDVTAIPFSALGVALADGHGETTFSRALTFAKLGYRTLVFRDNDKHPKAGDVAEFLALNGTILKWRDGHALEDELFSSLSEDGVGRLIDQALEENDPDLVEQHIRTASNNQLDLQKCRATPLESSTRKVLGQAAKGKKNSWFKNISAMENVGRIVVGPDLSLSDSRFKKVIEELLVWVSRA